jgi:general secretion pathway protein A
MRERAVLDCPSEASAASEAPAGFAALGLRGNPFDAASGPGRLVPTRRTQQIFDEITEAIEARKGLIVLTGEVGTGKTTLINQLRAWLRKKDLPVAFVFNPLLDADEFFEFALADFGIRMERMSSLNPIVRLQSWLLERYHEGETPVLIVDEAQSLPLPVLEALGLLVNLEMNQRKLLQIVMCGQPEFDLKLKKPELRKLQQRIALRCLTLPLTDEEFRTYVDTRLRSAGADRRPIFSEEAMQALLAYSRGIPRVVNLLCEHSLRDAASQQVRPIPPEIVEEVARRFQFDRRRPHAPQAAGTYGREASARRDAHATSPIATSLEEPAARPREKQDSQSPKILAEIPAGEYKPAPVVAIDRFTSKKTAPAVQFDKLAQIRPPMAASSGMARPQALETSPEQPPRNTITASATGILSFCKRCWALLMQWLQQPIRPARPRDILGTRRA